ncbi:TetR family transcriptional regulator [Wenjunlia vitaminophila]|uniref:TetR family transcriptional regulator n=1 Tax=Wenjunlia vitaminophila TaxID=76728 RepID=A0A0T6LSY6_WENVI|nr:TetR family transcriptional regulator [Wenjunlia vitaminophila]KRV49136.1 TetR family transcriptional regulator [Wenjunlia vitaminophila]
MSAGTNGPLGLRERKKRQMHRAISDAAISLFLERGFDGVSVAEVADAVQISKPTLFRYFPTKEDLVLHRFADHETEAGWVVAERPPGESPLGALHAHFRTGLDRRDPVTGLNDDPEVLAFHRLVYGTPSLVARLFAYLGRSEEALAGALTEAVAGGVEPCVGRTGARLAAAQVLAVQRVLAQENWRRIAGGESADAVHPDAVAAADIAYAQLRNGAGGLFA